MKNRPEHLAVVIGRNRRVYARVYKLPQYIEKFSRHYLESERMKSHPEGFVPTGMVLERPTETTWIYRVQYQEVQGY